LNVGCNNVAGDVALAFRVDLVQTARLFALLNVAIHDGLQTSWTSKFDYGLWRPVTAISRADEHGNLFTQPDPDWLPLLVTPPYPTYAGNAATIGVTCAARHHTSHPARPDFSNAAFDERAGITIVGIHQRRSSWVQDAAQPKASWRQRAGVGLVRRTGHHRAHRIQALERGL